MGRKDARKIVPGELVLDQIPLQVQLLEEKSGKEELTWRGRTPPRRASRPDRCLLGTKPLGRKLTLTCFGFSPLREQSLEGESLRGDREPKQFVVSARNSVLSLSLVGRPMKTTCRPVSFPSTGPAA